MEIAYFVYAAPCEHIEAVRKGLGRFAPLVDPLGDDLPELEHHISAIHAVDA